MSRKRTQTSNPYAITVLFEVVPASHREFLNLVKDNAKKSVSLEPECYRFDVLMPIAQGAGAQVFLYEVYRDRAAFDAHLASAHFQSFDQATKHMVMQKTVLDYVVDVNRKA